MKVHPRPLTVLIVDDQRVVLRVFAQALERVGYLVQVADRAEAALDTVRTSPPDAILLDVTMPYVNGMGLLYRLRSTAPQIPLAMVTGTDLTAETRTELATLGVGVHLKPLTAIQIQGVVDSLVGRGVTGEAAVSPVTSDPVMYRQAASPPCMFCGHAHTADVTPADAPGIGRQYECAHCRRRFAVKSPSVR